MNFKLEQKLKELNIEDFVWLIIGLLVIAGIFSNQIQKDYLLTLDKQKKNQIHNINLIIFAVAFFIYIYFVFKSFESYKEKEDSKTMLNLLASLLILIAGAILLYVEIINTCDNIEENTI